MIHLRAFQSSPRPGVLIPEPRDLSAFTSRLRSSMADDSARRRDEAEALSAMFGDDFFETDVCEWILRCTDAHAELTVQLPTDYPSCSPPVLLLDAPSCERGQAEAMCRSFLEDFSPGEEYGATLATRFFESFERQQGSGHAGSGEAALVNAPEQDESAPVVAAVKLEEDLVPCACRFEVQGNTAHCSLSSSGFLRTS